MKDHLFYGGVRRMMGYKDAIIFLLGLLSFGVFPALLDDYINLKHINTYWSDSLGDIFNKKILSFEELEDEKQQTDASRNYTSQGGFNIYKSK